jgi:hypothetical protein
MPRGFEYVMVGSNVYESFTFSRFFLGCWRSGVLRSFDKVGNGFCEHVLHLMMDVCYAESSNTIKRLSRNCSVEVDQFCTTASGCATQVPQTVQVSCRPNIHTGRCSQILIKARGQNMCVFDIGLIPYRVVP